MTIRNPPVITPLLRLSATGLCLLRLAMTSPGATWQLQAPQLFEQSVTDHLQIGSDHRTVELESGELFEDDGPAAGHSYQRPRNQESLSPDIWIKKELLIPNPESRAAFLVVLSEEPFQAAINGTPLSLKTNQSGRQGYKAYALDPGLLKSGRNEIVLKASGKVLIGRDDEFALGSRTQTRHPNRSAKSTDGGRTWDYDHLGPDGQLDGEYGVRLFLDHYRPQGSLTLPVLDAGNLEGKTVGAPVRQVGPVHVLISGEPGTGGRFMVRARSGPSINAGERGWSDWQSLGEEGGTIDQPRGRYFQVTVELLTSNPLSTPRLKSVQVSVTPTGPEDWTSRLRVLEEHNEQILRTSIPFRYEPLDEPRLATLRKEYKLDEVVQGAQTELELLLRLGQWACNYWDWPNHIIEQYPPWDALQILKPHADGTPVGGFCQQFNLVFLQACESFGFPGRAISISQGRWQEKCEGGGHEIVELWSNEWRKWVYVDGALAWYIVDEKTGTPLSIWELRDRQLALLRGEAALPVRVVDAVRTRNKQFRWSGLGPPKPLNWYLELRMIPRSNFLQERAPLPLNQGTEEWFWTGHYVWSDPEVPAGFVFGQRVTRRSNFEWTLNQAHYVLESADRPGVVRVQVDTETPSFDTFLAEVDGGPKKPVASGFEWPLHSGKNQLRIRPRNLAGREGIPSWVVLDYPDAY